MNDFVQNVLIFGWSWPSVEEWRDFVIVFYGLMGVIALLVFTALILLLIYIIWGVRNMLRELLEDPVKPTIEEVRKTAESVRGTSDFMMDNAVSPVIRVVSAVRGIRRGIASLSGFRDRRR